MSDTSPHTKRRKIIAAGLIGNLTEWYDFAIYGYFVFVIAPQFFPAGNPAVSTFAAFGAFAAGFLVRPVGGLVFGYIGDKIGRAQALTLSIWAMVLPTVAIGMLPTYETIGILAPLTIIVLRLIQGLSVGGEFPSSMVFLVEHSAPDKRAFTSSWGVFGAVAGTMLGAATGAIVTLALSESQVFDWGWRIPFFMGAVTGLVGIYIRSTLGSERKAETPRSPIVDTFRTHWRLVLKIVAIKVTIAAGFYTTFVYSVTYFRDIVGLSSSDAYLQNISAMFVYLALIPLAAIISDKVGRKPVLLLGSGILVAFSVPLFWLMQANVTTYMLLGQIGFAVAIAIFSSGATAGSVELIPQEVRCTALALSHNLAMAIFGGTSPIVATWLITATGNPLAPAYWIMLAGVLSFFTIVFLVPETHSGPLSRLLRRDLAGPQQPALSRLKM